MRLLSLLLFATCLMGQSYYLATGNPSNYLDSTNINWLADSGACTGTTFHITSTISGTSDQTLYQYGKSSTSSLSCTLPLGVGVYRITLKFADVLGYSVIGQQIFNIYVNGSVARANFDIFGTIRAQNTAYDFVLPLYANLGSSITVLAAQVTGGAQLQAISAVLVSTTTTQFGPSPASVPSATGTPPTTGWFVDGTASAPQAGNPNSSMVFQRVNALPANIATAFTFDCFSTSGAAANSGCITVNSVIHDATIAKGGNALRATVYSDVHVASSVISTATLSAGVVTVTTASGHLIPTGGGAVIVAGTSGMTGLNGTFTATWVDATHFTISCGGCSGGPGSGGTAIVPVGYFASWDSCFKTVGPGIRVACHESDLNNQYADAGNDVVNQDATFNNAVYCSGNKCTVGTYMDSGDGGTGQWYFPLKFGAKAVVTGYPYIDSTSNSNAYAADFAWIGNNQAIRWADNTPQGNTSAGKWPLLFLSAGNDFFVSAPTGQVVAIGPNIGGQLQVSATKVTSSKPVVHTPVAFSALPAASTMPGAVEAVSDSATVVWGATITGGGTNTVLAFSNGTNWTVVGK